MMFRKTFSGDKNGCYKMTKTFVCITILCVFKYSSYLMAIRTLSHFHSLPYFFLLIQIDCCIFIKSMQPIKNHNIAFIFR